MSSHRPSVADLLRFVRWPNLVLIILFFLIAERAWLEPLRSLTGEAPALDRVQWILYIVDVLIVTVIGYGMNDLQDQSVDRVNRPERLLVRFPEEEGRVRAAILILFVVGAVITFFLGYTAQRLHWIWLYPAVLVALQLYASFGDRQGILGNVLVSALIAVLPLMLVIAEPDVWKELYRKHPPFAAQVTWSLLGFMGLMFFSSLGREWAKDAEDARGDALGKPGTLPQLKGLATTRMAVLGTLLGIGVMECCLHAALDATWLWWGATAVVVATWVVCALSVIRARVPEDFGLVSASFKWLMLFGLIQWMLAPSTFL